MFHASLGPETVFCLLQECSQYILPVSKNNNNDYCLVTLTSITMKLFEKLLLGHIKDSIPDSLDPLQFAKHHCRSTVDAISHTIHTTLAHIDSKNCYDRLLFVDCNFTFYTAIPSKLIQEQSLGYSATLYNWFWISSATDNSMYRLAKALPPP